ncbi:MAG: undecaprenyldiphospho-muramoylpentapeptide beta-N-acetylglucosaminyltransferase [Bacteroidota bacterium]
MTMHDLIQRTIDAPRVLFACGGTGGHVYPAIAIADALRRLVPEIAIAFAGTRERMEWEAVPKAGYPIHGVTVIGFPRGLSPKLLAFPFKLMHGFRESWRIVKGFDPDVVVGTGGYVTGPVLAAAQMQRRPTVIQEQNAYAGAANKLLAPRAAQVFAAFEAARPYFPKADVTVSGNPVRAELAEADRAAALDHFGFHTGEGPADASVLLVMGGSLGAGALNAALEQHLTALLDLDEKVHVIWQTGKRYFADLHARIPTHPRLRLMQYLDRMDYAYAAADLAVCRAGAITCSELALTGTPSILVPSPNVTADHQTKNAKALADENAAVLLPEPQLQADLLNHVRTLLLDDTARAAMAAAVRSLARPDAADDIARAVLALAGHTINGAQTQGATA